MNQTTRQIFKPSIKPPDETAHQHLHTGTYFGECIGLSRQANSPATVGLLLLQDLSLILNFFFRFFFMAPRPTATAVSSSHLSRTCLTGRDTSNNDTSHPYEQNQQNQDPYILPCKTKDFPQSFTPQSQIQKQQMQREQQPL